MLPPPAPPPVDTPQLKLTPPATTGFTPRPAQLPPIGDVPFTSHVPG